MACEVANGVDSCIVLTLSDMHLFVRLLALALRAMDARDRTQPRAHMLASATCHVCVWRLYKSVRVSIRSRWNARDKRTPPCASTLQVVPPIGGITVARSQVAVEPESAGLAIVILRRITINQSNPKCTWSTTRQCARQARSGGSPESASLLGVPGDVADRDTVAKKLCATCSRYPRQNRSTIAASGLVWRRTASLPGTLMLCGFALVIE
ncbi:hypothetical protein BD413DRAFT_214997 [Trametes elegans]|nr:hypothetical protein BD413DRAFT_214997 [Trametes elegans]